MTAFVTICIASDTAKDLRIADMLTTEAWEAPYLPNKGETFVSGRYYGDLAYVGVVEQITHHMEPGLAGPRVFTNIYCRVKS